MKILFFVGEFPKLSQTFILNQMTGLIDAGHDVWILAKKAESNGKVHDDVLKYHLMDKVIYYDQNGRDSKLSKGWGLSKGLCRHYIHKLLKKNYIRNVHLKDLLKYPNLILLIQTLRKLDLTDVDIVHAHFGPNGLLAQKLMQLGLLHGKLYTTFHGYDMLRYVKKHGDSVYEELFQSKHTQLPISEYWKNRCEQLGAKSKHTIVHHMGIDVGKFEYCPAVQEKEIRVLSVARFVEKKGIEYGISAVSQLIDQGYSIQYSIVGGGPLEEKLRTMIQEKHLEKHIHMLGWKTQNELIDIMKKAHIILLPSVTSQDGDMEGIPVLLMEAMAMGKIVVSTYHSGIPELIRHNDNGFLVEERDVEGLVRTLQIVITTPENWQRITENARKTVLEDFNIERLNNQLIDLFKGNYSK